MSATPVRPPILTVHHRGHNEHPLEQLAGQHAITPTVTQKLENAHRDHAGVGCLVYGADVVADQGGSSGW